MHVFWVSPAIIAMVNSTSMDAIEDYSANVVTRDGTLLDPVDPSTGSSREKSKYTVTLALSVKEYSNCENEQQSADCLM